MGSRRASLVGLDIGTSGVRAVELRADRRSGELGIHRAAALDLPRGVMAGGAVQDHKALADALRRLWRAGRFTSRRVAFAITDPTVLTRQLDLPWMNPPDFRNALRYQLQDALPVDMHAVQLDYHLLEERAGLDAKGHEFEENRILVVAADRARTTELAQVIRKAGLRPTVADLSPFAHIRAACANALPDDRSARAIVDLGAEQLTVTVHAGGQPRFIRTLSPLGGEAATDAIATTLDLSADDAERLKRETGLNGPAPVLVPVAESSVFNAISTTATMTLPPSTVTALTELNTWATGVVAEIRNSLDYHRASPDAEPVTTITVTGRAIALRGLRDRIATELGLPVVAGDPRAGLDVRRRARKVPDDAPLALAVGLAMARRP